MQIDKERALRDLEIDEEMYKELLNIFVEQTQEALDKMETAINSNDTEGIRKAAHFIKGSAGNLRLEGIHVIAREIELGAKEGMAIDQIQNNTVRLKAAFQEVKQEIS